MEANEHGGVFGSSPCLMQTPQSPCRAAVPFKSAAAFETAHESQADDAKEDDHDDLHNSRTSFAAFRVNARTNKRGKGEGEGSEGHQHGSLIKHFVAVEGRGREGVIQGA